MAIDTITLHVLLIVFIASFIRSAFGFGEGLVAVPLLAFYIPINVAAPLAVLLSITIAAVVVIQDWEKIHIGSAAWLLFATLFGIPVGLLLLTSAHQRLVKGVLGALILMFSLYSLLAETKSGKRMFGEGPELQTDNRSWLLVCGFFAGVLGGAYGMNGPPLVVYGIMRRWSAQHFRATLQGYFLPASIIGMAGYWLAGLWIPLVTHYFLISLPVTFPGVMLGRIFNHGMGGSNFLKYIYLCLAVIGVILLSQAVKG